MQYRLDFSEEAGEELRALPKELRRRSDLNNAIARNKGKPGIPWAQLKKELGIG
jgi:hypothetical protein